MSAIKSSIPHQFVHVVRQRVVVVVSFLRLLQLVQERLMSSFTGFRYVVRTVNN